MLVYKFTFFDKPSAFDCPTVSFQVHHTLDVSCLSSERV